MGEVVFDAVIAGAGPAGSIAARELARRGARVALVDKGRFPRDKVCGDFVGPRGVKELADLGLGAVLEGAGVNRITRGNIFLDGRLVLRKPLPQVEDLPPYGCMLPREVLDARLFEAARAAGAEAFEDHTFLEYADDGSSVRVRLRAPSGERTLRARALVGADGSASLVALQLRGAPQPRADRINAVRAYFEGVAGDSDSVDLHFTRATFPGYLWIFPTGLNRANVGIGMAARTFPKARRHLRDLLHDALARDPAVRARLGGAHACGKVVGWPLCTYNADLALRRGAVGLIGDAAGFINPVNGEGIQYAIESGRWIAEALGPALATQGGTSRRGAIEGALAGYAERVRREIGLDMALNRLLTQLACNRALNPVWLALLGGWSARGDRDDAYLSVAASVVAGLLPTRRMFEPATRDVSFATAFETLRAMPTAELLEAVGSLGSAAFENPPAALGWLRSVLEAGAQVALARAA